MVGVLTIALASFMVSGCSASPEAHPEPAPTPSLTQEQQDEAAFEDLYATLLSIDENTETREELAEVLAAPALDDELNGAESIKGAGEHVEGRLTYSHFEVTDHSETSMIARVCSDTSGTTVFDSSGKPMSNDNNDEVSLAMKATRASSATPWRISEIVRDDGVRACG
ncbi:hypothetical protein [Clavibacter nebraskensis]|uniref:hypothetical protein n=1 Tax=Clavibacter nebraskensis TaxID=31963 RepID=UPI003F83E59E